MYVPFFSPELINTGLVTLKNAFNMIEYRLHRDKINEPSAKYKVYCRCGLHTNKPYFCVI